MESSSPWPINSLPELHQQQELTNNSSNSSGGKNEDEALLGLAEALFSTFFVVICGYLATWSGVLPGSGRQVLGALTSRLFLPALVIRSLATLDTALVNWRVILAIGLAKLAVFLLTAGVSIAIDSGGGGQGQGQGEERAGKIGIEGGGGGGGGGGGESDVGRTAQNAGVRGMAAVCSNDFALGLPILQAMYPPQLIQYIYLIAPVQFLLFNPLGLVLLETARDRRKRAGGGGGGGQGCALAALRVAGRVFINPLVIAAVIGVVLNISRSGAGLPKVVDNPLRLLGQAFTAAALLALGSGMVGSSAFFRGRNLRRGAAVGVLSMAKLILLPIIIAVLINLLGMDIVQVEGVTYHLSLFGFIYGTLPTAPGVLAIAIEYDVLVPETVGIVVASTLVSAPLAAISVVMASTITVATEIRALDATTAAVGLYTRPLSAAGAALLLLVLILRGIFNGSGGSGSSSSGGGGSSSSALLKNGPRAVRVKGGGEEEEQQQQQQATRESQWRRVGGGGKSGGWGGGRTRALKSSCSNYCGTASGRMARDLAIGLNAFYCILYGVMGSFCQGASAATPMISVAGLYFSGLANIGLFIAPAVLGLQICASVSLGSHGVSRRSSSCSCGSGSSRAKIFILRAITSAVFVGVMGALLPLATMGLVLASGMPTPSNGHSDGSCIWNGLPGLYTALPSAAGLSATALTVCVLFLARRLGGKTEAGILAYTVGDSSSRGRRPTKAQQQQHQDDSIGNKATAANAAAAASTPIVSCRTPLLNSSSATATASSFTTGTTTTTTTTATATTATSSTVMSGQAGHNTFTANAATAATAAFEEEQNGTHSHHNRYNDDILAFAPSASSNPPPPHHSSNTTAVFFVRHIIYLVYCLVVSIMVIVTAVWTAVSPLYGSLAQTLFLTYTLESLQGLALFVTLGTHASFWSTPAQLVAILRTKMRRLVYATEDTDARWGDVQVAHLLAFQPHMLACRLALCRTLHHGLRAYPNSFRGDTFVSWVQAHGLAVNRTQALALGKSLFHAGVLHHVVHEHTFHDAAFFYRFAEDGEQAITTALNGIGVPSAENFILNVGTYEDRGDHAI